MNHYLREWEAMDDERMTAAPDLMPHFAFRVPSPTALGNHVSVSPYGLHPLSCKRMFGGSNCAAPDSFSEVFRDVKNASF